MKYFTAALFLLAGSASAFRDQSTKKNHKAVAQRRLETETTCEVNHDLAQSVDEITVHVEGFPQDGKGLFNITVSDQPWAPENGVTVMAGWCLDFPRPIDTGDWSVDVFSAFDPDIHHVDGEDHMSAVDNKELFPNLAWMINNFAIGDAFDDGDGCAGTVSWLEIQGAIWMLMGGGAGEGTPYELYREDCISQAINSRARAEGNGYEPDCFDENEIIPIVYVIDDESGEVTHQTVMSETLLKDVEGMCECTTTEKGGDPNPAPPKVTDPPAPDSPDPTSPPGVKGDPHFKTFAGEMYDFHGECDLVLLHNPEFKNNQGMDIHIRTKIENFWSSVETAAIKIGDSTMEITADPGSEEWLWVDGHLVSGGLEVGKWYEEKIGGFLIRYKESSAAVREANIYIEGAKEFLLFKTYKSFVRIDIPWKDSQNYFGSSGLLGSYDNDGKRLGRSGKFIEDTHDFGKEWQVQETEPAIFHSYKGAVVGKGCVMPPAYSAEKAAQMKRRLAESGMTQEDAEKACDHLSDPEEVKSCVFDVIATQDLDMAGAW